LFACENKIEQTKAKAKYFSVNNLLDSQAVVLAGKTLTKKENQTDSIVTNKPDWQEEFKILRSFDINKPVWQDAFRIVRDGNYLIYTNDNDKINVKQLKVLINGGQVHFLSGVYIDENLLYRIEKNFSVKLKDGKIERYRLESKQKIVFQEEFDILVDCFVR
jgi:hypothetical protein